MRIEIIAVGKLKEDYLKDALKYYTKKIQKHSLEIIEVPDEKASESYSAIEIEKVKRKEGQKILSYISNYSYVFALDILGKNYTTKMLGKTIQKVNNMGFSQIIFIIGGSNGLSPEVLQRAQEKISFSPMTFPHQLMRVILVEQIEKIQEDILKYEKL